MAKLHLDGCTPEPLMGYLKALGVLRLVSEQADPEARGAWRDGMFVLDTKLVKDGLVRFFFDQYRPTPLLAPWNGGSGFYVKLDLDKFLETQGKSIEFKSREVVESIDAICASDVDRLSRYRDQIASTKGALGLLGEEVDLSEVLAEPLRQYPGKRTKAQKKAVKVQATKILNLLLLFQTKTATFSIGKAAKDEFISDLRGKVLTDDGLLWLDATLAMRTGQKKNRVEAPTLGSGGNIGNSDFSARFAQMLREIIPFRSQEKPPECSRKWLEAALFGSPAPQLLTTSVDQFDPGKAGGANGTQAMEASPILNPWDYVLMLEGALALAGNTSRRFGAGRNSASFPFTVDSSAAGYGSIGRENTRGELWLPLWEPSCTYGELIALLSEGRAEVGRQRAWSGLSFAQAVAGLGVDRGIKAFVRYEFQERLGQSFLATPIGRFEVPNHPREGIELVRGLNPLLYELRAIADDAKTPSRFSAAVRAIDASMFDFCKYGGSDRLADIVAALGAAERELAVGDVPPDKRRVRPLSRLSSDWIIACGDVSQEFRLACSLAFLHAKKTGPIRRYLEPVKFEKGRWVWAERGGHVVWSGGSLARNLGAVLARRLMDAEKAGEASLPLGSQFPTALADVAAFMLGQVDDQKLEDLIWGLMLVDPNGPELSQPSREYGSFLPGAYALLKLTLLPWRLIWRPHNGRVILKTTLAEEEGGIAVKPEPGIVSRLRAGDVQGACEVATRRLRASGLPPLATHHGNGSRRLIAWSVDDLSPDRLLAALLFPVSKYQVNGLADLVLRRPELESLA